MQNSFDKEDFQAPLAEINMTPFVDIMLVLLVILLVTAPIIQSAIEVDLPSETGQNIEDKNPVSIIISRDGNYFIEQKPASLSDLQNHLINIGKEDPQTPIHIKADESVSYGKVNAVLAILQKSGLSNIGFINQNR
ncbi:MAG: ExbD/TolR family protein [Alphaproteobacteria bacterium]